MSVMVYYISQGIHIWIILSGEYKHVPLNANTFYTIKS